MNDTQNPPSDPPKPPVRKGLEDRFPAQPQPPEKKGDVVVLPRPDAAPGFGSQSATGPASGAWNSSGGTAGSSASTTPSSSLSASTPTARTPPSSSSGFASASRAETSSPS